jgi:hypothetical protein
MPSNEHALEEECLWRGRHTDSRSVGAVRRPGIDREAPTRGSRRHHRPHTADGDMEGGDDTMTRLDSNTPFACPRKPIGEHKPMTTATTPADSIRSPTKHTHAVAVAVAVAVAPSLARRDQPRRPATQSGTNSRLAVAEWLKPAPMRAQPRPSDLRLAFAAPSLIGCGRLRRCLAPAADLWSAPAGLSLTG